MKIPWYAMALLAVGAACLVGTVRFEERDGMSCKFSGLQSFAFNSQDSDENSRQPELGERVCNLNESAPAIAVHDLYCDTVKELTGVLKSMPGKLVLTGTSDAESSDRLMRECQAK
jgi:hypothetical protein